MTKVLLPSSELWGHHSPEASPDEIIDALVTQTERAIRGYCALPEGPEPCGDRDGYFRVSVTIPLTSTLFDQLMNGANGYRAHYSVSVEAGEAFNRRLVDAVAPIIACSETLYGDKFDQPLCRKSLLGPFSKFWYPKELTDPSAQAELLELKEELRIPRWMEYWRTMEKPRKGLLAPIPEGLSVLLNGTFVDEAGAAYEQKPNRSRQIFDTGWT
ncbi:hypothetical protein GPA22_08725 [Aromatoleum toluvorans]|uniref:Uncharacterized protein n=1 Tax=Aromatoleum toluvorans TaxID=92002 RepID=A0ABX1PWT9_9RHOO|nr:hypothetical protein [Aromatoleum toluvorans]NMG43813.1 hypothetical protein [Aromatoleum toluvorans]